MKDKGEVKLYETCLTHAWADRALRSFIAKELEQYDVTLMEWLMLSVVCNAEGEGLSMSAVAKELDVTLPQVTALTNKLLQQKLIEQQVQSHDRRARHVFPTAKGRDVWQSVERSMSENLYRWLYTEANITADDLQHYLRIARHIGGRSEQP